MSWLGVDTSTYISMHLAFNLRHFYHFTSLPSFKTSPLGPKFRRKMAPVPATTEAQKHSPSLDRLLKSRLAPIREAALMKAAMGNEKPAKPAAGDCCGSSCIPCVMDLYREELRVWKECAEFRASLSNMENASSHPDSLDTITQDSSKSASRIPGSFDW